mgnify:FL=1
MSDTPPLHDIVARSEDEPDKPEDTGKKPPASPSNKLPRPPVQTIVFWLVVLCVVPALLVWLGDSRRADEIDELNQSEFE